MSFMENLDLNVFDCVPVTFLVRPGQTPDGISELQQWASAMAMRVCCVLYWMAFSTYYAPLLLCLYCFFCIVVLLHFCSAVGSASLCSVV